jgi:hypothetical protein
MKNLWIRRRVLAFGALTMLLGGSAFVVQYVDGMRASAADCSTASVCAHPARRFPIAPPVPPRLVRAQRWTRRLAATPPRLRAPIRAVDTAPAPAPTTCAGVVKSIAWPPRWRVQCDGPHEGLLGATQPAGVTDLFVRADETMAWLRVVALHEAGHAWDFARLDPTRIARWCAVRGCDADNFFAGRVSSEGWSEASGAEDWAAAWDSCHGGEYHRSYMGLAAPLPSECALQNILVDYPR